MKDTNKEHPYIIDLRSTFYQLSPEERLIAGWYMSTATAMTLIQRVTKGKAYYIPSRNIAYCGCPLVIDESLGINIVELRAGESRWTTALNL